VIGSAVNLKPGAAKAQKDMVSIARIELCPKHLFNPQGGLALMRCCMVEKSVELSGRVAVVPWGAELPVIEEALRALVGLAKGAA
jgi:hypothetical protein